MPMAIAVRESSVAPGNEMRTVVNMKARINTLKARFSDKHDSWRTSFSALAVTFLFLATANAWASHALVQTQTLNGAISQLGNGTPVYDGEWAMEIEPFSSSLGELESVTFEAHLTGSFDSTEFNPFSFPITHAPGIYFSVAFYGFEEFLGEQEFSANGPSVILPPSSAYSFPAEMDQSFVFTVPASGLTNFIGDAPGGLATAPWFWGLNSYGFGSGTVTIETRLTYEYTPREVGLLPHVTGTVFRLLNRLLP